MTTMKDCVCQHVGYCDGSCQTPREINEGAYHQGFVDGLKEAARTMREAARDHYEQSVASKKVLENQAHQLAASLFASWANGMDIRADNFKG